jgi:hypothetical protein
MISKVPRLLTAASATRQFSRLRRFLRARAGIAAVEFAFILPMMLVLYFGIVVLGQGLEIGRKVHEAARTLADLTAQQLPSSATGTTPTGNCSSHTQIPCVADGDLTDFFAGAKLVLQPFSTTTLSATISEVVFDNVGVSNTKCCQARVMWSAGFGNNPVLRACGLLNSSTNGVNGASSMPRGNYPGGLGDAVTDNAPSVTSGNTTDTYLIVADVTYQYQPGFNFNLFAWNQNANGGSGYTINQTVYMTPRSGATVSQTNTNDSNAEQAQAIIWNPAGAITSYHNCPCVTSTSASCTVGTATGTQYNVP